MTKAPHIPKAIRLYLRKIAALHAGFLVNSTYFGTGGANQLGINATSWQNCYNGYPACSEPYGKCTIVANGSAYDQFSAFRANTLANALTQPYTSTGASCQFIPNAYGNSNSWTYLQVRSSLSACCSGFRITHCIIKQSDAARGTCLTDILPARVL